MNNVDKQYFDMLRHILKHGCEKTDRTGTGTISVFDYTMNFKMKEGFPLLTSKKMAWKSMVIELLWFLRGDTNIKWLVDNGCNIWVGDAYKNYLKSPLATTKDVSYNILYKNIHNGWCVRTGLGIIAPDPTRHLTREEFITKIKSDDKEFIYYFGNLGPVYGKQWRNWEVPRVCDIDGWYDEPIDQISNLINELKTNPDSRRLMVNAWNVAELSGMVLPPCHYGFQCYTRELSNSERISWIMKNNDVRSYYSKEDLDELNVPKRYLSLKWTQRSCDVFLGVPFNISSYGLLLHLLAKEVNMIPENLIFSGGDCHIYSNHIEQCKKQLRQKTFKLPNITLSDKSIFDVQYEDITLNNYEYSPSIKGELSN